VGVLDLLQGSQRVQDNFVGSSLDNGLGISGCLSCVNRPLIRANSILQGVNFVLEGCIGGNQVNVSLVTICFELDKLRVHVIVNEILENTDGYNCLFTASHNEQPSHVS